MTGAALVLRRTPALSNPVRKVQGAARAEYTAAIDLKTERRFLFERIHAFYDVKVLHAAVECGLFAALAEEGKPRAIDALASRTGTKARGLRAILLGLRVLGLVQRDDSDSYSLTESGEYFLDPTRRKILPGSLRSPIGSSTPSLSSLAR